MKKGTEISIEEAGIACQVIDRISSIIDASVNHRRFMQIRFSDYHSCAWEAFFVCNLHPVKNSGFHHLANHSRF
jgi:hypothetical protein